jgi:hypothetical protein
MSLQIGKGNPLGNATIVGTPEGDRAGPAIERFNIVDLRHITRLEQIERTTQLT